MELSASLCAQNTNIYEIPAFNDPSIVSKMTEFHKITHIVRCRWPCDQKIFVETRACIPGSPPDAVSI